MDLQTLAIRTGVPIRKLRYVLDHRLLPGMRIKHALEFVGHPRSFAEHEGFGIACAAALVEAGVRRESISLFMDALCGLVLKSQSKRRIPRTVFLAAFEDGAEPAIAIIADNAVVRFTIKQFDSGWIEPRAFNRISDFSPRVTIQLDLAKLRRAVKHSSLQAD